MKNTAIAQIVFLLGLLCLAACSGTPPLDALEAAELAIGDAGLAEDCAPEEYRAAVRLLEDARAANQQGDFERARTLAQAARDQAERARLVAQANADDCEAAQHLFNEDPDNVYTSPDLTFADYELIPVYFDYDASTFDERTRQVLARHAEFINANSFRVIIEGHCDHNGTDSYNLALGERRGRGVAQQLVTLGVDPSRLSTISYGEFRSASEHDQSLNRRAEFRAR